MTCGVRPPSLRYNKLDQLTLLSQNGATQAKFVYDERGNITSTTRSNKTYTSNKYDDSNRIAELKNYKSSGSLLDSYKYKYDSNGNPTTVVTDKGSVSYEYDSLNQLIKETLVDGKIFSYEYDGVGNRTKKSETNGTIVTTTNYTYNTGNQLTTVNNQAYTYDQNGNLTNDGEKTFLYNEQNQLIEAKDKTGNSLAKFTYDHEGKRTSMKTTNNTINYHYLDNMVIAETDENKNVIAEYTWDAEGYPVTMTRNGKVYYYHTNGHGDVTALTDENNNVVAEYNYDAWGNITSQTGTIASFNPYRYAGYRYDEATKLYYLMARYYDPNLGRFITRDTFQGFEDEPYSQNIYAYTHNNPVKYYDPDGEKRTLIIKGGKWIWNGAKNAGKWVWNKSKGLYKRVTLPDVQFAEKQLQKKFNSHAKDFGVKGNYNKDNAKKFKNAIKKHIDNADIIYETTISGQNGKVYLYMIGKKGVFTDTKGNFISGWNLNDNQLNFHKTKGFRLK